MGKYCEKSGYLMFEIFKRRDPNLNGMTKGMAHDAILAEDNRVLTVRTTVLIIIITVLVSIISTSLMLRSSSAWQGKQIQLLQEQNDILKDILENIIKETRKWK